MSFENICIIWGTGRCGSRALGSGIMDNSGKVPIREWIIERGTQRSVKGKEGWGMLIDLSQKLTPKRG